jgi:hypothetical protein
MRKLQHGPDEAVTSPGNRFNESLVITQGLSQQKDVIGQASFFDERVGPKRPDHLVLLKHVPTIPDQQVESVKSFRRERHRLSTAQQHALVRIEAEGAKFVKTQSLPARRLSSHREPIAETFRGGSGVCFLAQSPSLDPRENSLRNL